MKNRIQTMIMEPYMRPLSTLIVMLVTLSSIYNNHHFVLAETEQSPIFINSGGPAYTDGEGNNWLADTYFNTGSKYPTDVPIANTDDDVLYQTERWDPASGPELKYSIPVLNGEYDVYLHFSENYSGAKATGARVFNVSIGGTVEMQNVDIFDEAGAGNTALIKHATTTVDDELLTIEFIHVTENPKISAIAVYPTNYVVPPPDDSPSAAPSVAPPTDSSFTPIYINAGGGAFTDSTGKQFVADDYYNTGNTWTASSINILGTEDDALYRSERWDSGSSPELKYTIPVPNGDYVLTLHFAENYDKAQVVGKRVFHVVVDGSMALENFDIFAEAGASTALQKTIPVAVSRGELDIQFIHVTQNPKISAIEVAKAEAPTEPTPPTPTAVPSTMPSMSPVSDISMYINVGGGEYIDTSGRVWEADEYYNTGETYKIGQSRAIAGAADPEIYRSERWDGPNGPELTYNIPLENGDYTVKLYFADIFQGTHRVGARVFDVSIEGTVVFKDLDIFDEVGGFAALEKSAPVTVTEGSLSIQLIHVNENPKLSAISIHSENSDPSPSTPVPSSAPSGETNIASPDPTEVPSSMPSTVPSAMPVNLLDPTEVPSSMPSSMPSEELSAFNPIYINAGGPQYTDSAGTTWEADRSYNTGGVFVAKSSQEISGADDPTIYQSERWDGKNMPVLKYELSVPNGEYSVSLHFADIYSGTHSIGARVFDVSMQGEVVWQDLDIFAEVGGFAALNKTALATVTDGSLSIELLHVTQNPKISAIEVHEAPPPAPTATPTTAQPTLTMAPSKVPSSSPSYMPTVEGYFEPIRINVGGGTITDSDNRVWVADDYFNTGGLYETSKTISGDVDQRLYKTERFHDPGMTNLIYQIPVGDGDYLVTFHFADIWPGTHEVGARVFDVLIEGFGVFKDLDIYSEVGGFAPLVKSAVSGVSDGSLTIEFVSIVQSAKISAIEVEALGTVKDHQAHAVAGGPYFQTDTDDDGFEGVVVDGTYSHTHGIDAILFSWEWTTLNETELGSGENATLTLPVGVHEVKLTVIDSDGDVSSDSTTVTVRPYGFPDITSLTPDAGDFAGGEKVVITGSGFTAGGSNVTVHFGLVPLNGPSEITVIDDNTIEVLDVPPRDPGTAMVTVETSLGVSNAVGYVYINFSLPPVQFTTGTIIPYIYSPTTLAFGPDGRLYVGTRAGDLLRITLNDQHEVVDTLLSTTVATSVEDFRCILGIAFDPMDTSANPTVYVSHSYIFHGLEESYNGMVSAVSGANLDTIEHVVTGLPVSDHDHAVNGIFFGDHGELYIQVGGNTNGGVPGALSSTGLQEEGALSAATVVAHLSRPGYDGNVTYNNGDQISGFDVEVFASGQRNPYDIVLHSNGHLYATDNGPNVGFGKKSTSCTTEDEEDPAEGDKLNLIVEGGFYGHPNRKRGECEWRSLDEPSDVNYTAPIKELKSSSNGIVEFQTDHFGGQLRGHLIVGRYKGELFDITLASDGLSVLNNVETLETTGGLDVTQGPDGTLFVVQNDKAKVVYYAPDEISWTELRVKSSFPRRGPESGGSLLTLYGENFNSYGTPTVTVGDEDCPLSAPASATKITCTLPAGSGTADVVVEAGGRNTTFVGGYRYITGVELDEEPSEAIE